MFYRTCVRVSREPAITCLDTKETLADSGGAVFLSVMSNPLALDNPVATVLVFGPLVGSALVEHRRFRGDSLRRFTDRTYWRLQVWQLVGLLLGVLVARAVPGAALPGPAWAWPVVGCVVGLAGVSVRWWAIRTLGARFTRDLQVAVDHKIVVDGPIGTFATPRTRGRSSCSPASASVSGTH